jgi:hypothetical protein
MPERRIIMPKSIFHDPARVKVFDNRKDAVEFANGLCGFEIVRLTKESLEALQRGEIVGFEDGEYANLLILEGVELVK